MFYRAKNHRVFGIFRDIRFSFKLSTKKRVSGPQKASLKTERTIFNRELLPLPPLYVNMSRLFCKKRGFIHITSNIHLPHPLFPLHILARRTKKSYKRSTY